MNFDEWIEEVITLAATSRQEELIRNGYFMYEYYYEQGKTPQEAYREEWGE